MSKMIRPNSIFEAIWLAPQSSSRSRFAQRAFLVMAIIASLMLINRFRVEYTNAALRAYHPIDDLNGGDAAEQSESDLEALSMERGGNETLGFHKIWFVNLKKRFDRTDAATVQAFLSGIEFEDYPAVEQDQISDIGMPPTHRPSVLTTGEHGCWRAHANIWTEVLRKKLPPVLIFESDAVWDINVREIMSNMNKYFVEFLREIDSKPIPNPRYGWKPSPPPETFNATHSNSTTKSQIAYNPDDPWLSEHWDLLSLGHCFENGPNHEIHHVYPDPWVPAGKEYYGYTLGNERLIRRSGGITCTTSYAISQTGAAKLLLRSSVDLDNPVDLLIRRMTMSGDLIAYSVMPTIIAQWEYAKDIGMELRGAQSDIRGGTPEKVDKDAVMKGWDDVKKSKSVWVTKWHHPEVAFQNMALSVAWEKILGKSKLEDSQYKEADGN